MPTIRQEINILTSAYTGTGTVSSNEIAQLDTTRYSGTCTFYFEAVFSGAASNTGTIVLTRSGTTTNDASIAGATSATVGLVRSASFTPPAGATNYIVRLIGDGTRSQTVKAARIVVVQTEGTISKTRVVIELGNTQGFTATTLTALTNPKYFKFVAANWDGVLVAGFQVCGKTSSASATGTCELQISDGTGDGFVNWASATVSATAADMDVTFNSTTIALTTLSDSVSGKAIILRDGRNYRIACKDSSSKSTFTVYSAKLTIDCYNNLTQDFEGGVRPSNWRNDTGSPNWGATPALDGSFSLSVAGSTGAAFIMSKDYSEVQLSFLMKTPAALTIANIIFSIFNFGTDTSTSYPADEMLRLTLNTNGTLQVSCSGGGSAQTTTGTMSVATTYKVFVYFKFVTNGTSLASVGFTTDTTQVVPVANGDPNNANLSNGTATVGARQFEFGPGGSGSDGFVFDDFVLTLIPLKELQTEYLLANSILAAGTALQNFLTKWDTADWMGAKVVFEHAADAANGSTSVVELDTAAGVQLTGSVVTSPDNEGISSTITMPAVGNLDVKATTNNSDVYASKMLALVDLTIFPQKGVETNQAVKRAAIF